MNTEIKPSTTKLTLNDLAVFESLADKKILSIRQIQQLHFSKRKRNREGSGEATVENLRIIAAKRMQQLEREGYIESRYCPLNSSQTKKVTRPTKLIIFTKKCQQNVKRELTKTRRVTDWENIATMVHQFNKPQSFDAQTELEHHEGISETLIAIDANTNSHSTIATNFAVRTHPRHSEIREPVAFDHTYPMIDFKSKKVVMHTTTEEGSMNPDMFWCTSHKPGVYDFFTKEFDNDTSSYKTFLKKMSLYEAYRSQRRFHALCRHWCEAYGLPFAQIEEVKTGADGSTEKNAYFRVLVVINSHKRDPMKRLFQLFAGTMQYPTKTFFNFTTLAQFRNDAFGPIWYNRRCFAPFEDEYNRSVKNSLPVVQNRFFAEKIPQTEPMPLFV